MERKEAGKNVKVEYWTTWITHYCHNSRQLQRAYQSEAGQRVDGLLYGNVRTQLHSALLNSCAVGTDRRRVVAESSTSALPFLTCPFGEKRGVPTTRSAGNPPGGIGKR